MPSLQEETKLERIRKLFRSKIEGKELMNFSERLKELKLKSLEIRKRYIMIYVWQQVERIRDDVLELKCHNKEEME